MKVFPAHFHTDKMIHEFTFMSNYDPAFSVPQQKQKHFWSPQSSSFTDDSFVHIPYCSELTAENLSLVQCLIRCAFSFLHIIVWLIFTFMVHLTNHGCWAVFLWNHSIWHHWSKPINQTRSCPGPPTAGNIIWKSCLLHGEMTEVVVIKLIRLRSL